MNEKTAILIADLSGYTALTETHGAEGAADIIDRYLDIVYKSLAGDSMLYESTGDEVMIISSSPFDLLATANSMLINSSVDHFLQVHGGLHYGPVLHRNNRIFGNTINLTARIAAQAQPGTMWCSEDFLYHAGKEAAEQFSSRGKKMLKNLREPKALFQLMPQKVVSGFIDPVCKMVVHDRGKAIPHPEEEELYFCGHNCLDLYTAYSVV